MRKARFPNQAASAIAASAITQLVSPAFARAAAKASPDKDCYQCHRKHASDDNVWVQFYPTLLQVAKQKGTVKPISSK